MAQTFKQYKENARAGEREANRGPVRAVNVRKLDNGFLVCIDFEPKNTSKPWPTSEESAHATVEEAAQRLGEIFGGKVAADTDKDGK
ncbi:MAG TPA: hypothetical protein VHI13_08805 [Candidatus Kapabacteria bacterium]|nr:hypothetical protein [Candidatus Kapabacteria bacterium]